MLSDVGLSRLFCKLQTLTRIRMKLDSIMVTDLLEALHMINDGCVTSL